MISYSVIIPALNEEKRITKCILSITNARSGVEIIVVDGGSKDDTLNIAERLGAKLVLVEQGRGNQLNAGGQLAKGDVLLFLHADTLLSKNAFEILDKNFEDKTILCGTFLLDFDYNHWLLKFYAWMARVESFWTSFGDQCIVARKPFFEKLKGFPDWPLFEDVGFLQNAREITTVHRFSTFVMTSADAFLKNGIVRQQFKNARLIFKYSRGESPYDLYREYYNES